MTTRFYASTSRKKLSLSASICATCFVQNNYPFSAYVCYSISGKHTEQIAPFRAPTVIVHLLPHVRPFSLCDSKFALTLAHNQHGVAAASARSPTPATLSCWFTLYTLCGVTGGNCVVAFGILVVEECNMEREHEKQRLPTLAWQPMTPLQLTC
jgi:hypothetical protein